VNSNSNDKLAIEEGFDVLNLQEAVELADPGWMPHFAQRFGFNLPDAFPGDPELFAHLFQGAGIAIANPKSEFQNFSFAFVQAGKHIGQLVFEQSKAGDIDRAFRVLVFNKIADVGFFTITDWGPS
jgi:hypothetical protein